MIAPCLEHQLPFIQKDVLRDFLPTEIFEKKLKSFCLPLMFQSLLQVVFGKGFGVPKHQTSQGMTGALG